MTGYIASCGDEDDLARCIVRRYESEVDFAAQIRNYKDTFNWRSFAAVLIDGEE